MRGAGLSPVLVAALLAACGGSGGGLRSLPEGAWGGEHIGLSVRATGAAVELDCAHGEITVPLRVGADGAFRFPGYYVRDVGPAFDPEQRRPTTYFGGSAGPRLDLSFTLDTGETAGPFTATLGGTAEVVKCR